MWMRKVLPSNLSSLNTIRLGQSFRTGSPQGPSDTGSASSLQLFCPWHTQAYVPWLSEGEQEHRSVDLARGPPYIQEAGSISVSGCFKGIAGSVSSGCLGDLTVLVIKQEQLLPDLPLFTVIFKRKSALLGLRLLVEAIKLQPELWKLIVDYRKGNSVYTCLIPFHEEGEFPFYFINAL